MARVKKGLNAHKRHKKVLKMAKGFYGAKHSTYRAAKPATMRALRSAYVGRKNRKRDFRKLWIARISAAVRAEGLSYSQFMHALKISNIELNRKALSNMAIEDKASFSALVATAKKALEA
jgi:large subunit ribosomal protein L20